MPELPDLVHDRRGSGEPVVLIHGIGHRRQIWDPIVDDLATRYEVITLDLAGFGQSPPLPHGRKYSMPNATEHLAQQFEKWGVEKPHVVGNSLGGAIALELGARNLVSSVTALSPAGFFGPVSRIQAIATLILLRLAAVITPTPVLRWLSTKRFGRTLAGLTLYTHPQRHSAEATFGDAMGLKRCKGFERTALAGLRYRFDGPTPVPTTVAWGTTDRILHHSQADIARLRLTEARHVDLPHCGHVPIADDPELVTRVIDQTIADARASKAA
jgi:pimeloyl-ACP methyl ester carboxylesterase